MTKIRKSRKKPLSLVMASNKQLATKWPSQLIVRENPVLCKINEWSDNQGTNIASFYQPLVVIFYHNLSSNMNRSFGQLTTFSILLKEIVENQIGTNFIHISMVLKSFVLTRWLICDETKSPFIFLLIEEYAKMEQAGDKRKSLLMCNLNDHTTIYN